MRFAYLFTGQPKSEVRVNRSAMTQGETWAKESIEGWFESHDKPQPGASIRIPDRQVDAHRFQPS
jgi:hypothetical protein